MIAGCGVGCESEIGSEVGRVGVLDGLCVCVCV